MVEIPEAAKEFVMRRHVIIGAAVGFAGPVGLDKADVVFIDHAVAVMASGTTGANKTDYHIANVVPGRDFSLEGENISIVDVRNAVEGDTLGGKKLLFKRGIEVGQVFKLGSKYAEKLGAKVLAENGKQATCLMGCYGIGINRIMASAVENFYDENGIVWPISIAPFEVLITIVDVKSDDLMQAGNDLYYDLKDRGIDVLLDDRKARGGVKFKDADLVGIPVRVTIGKRGFGEGVMEVKLRRGGESENVEIDSTADYIEGIIGTLYAELGK